MTAAHEKAPVGAEEKSVATTMPLSRLRRGQAGEVVEVCGPRLFRRRLLEMGLVPGTEVRLVNVAPLGDPLELEVRHCRLSIRRGEAEQVRVRVTEARRALKVLA